MNFNEDNIRTCSHCGKPMKEGYILGEMYACSDECAIALYNGDEKALRADLADADTDDNDTHYYTEWESVFLDE